MIATVVLAATLELPIDVIATVPIAENMPSSTAQRPGDVLTQYGGVTVEVLNTDAEGRLILADAIVRAAGRAGLPDRDLHADGAQTVALGARTPGVMGSEEFRDRVAAISQRGRERLGMLLPIELKDDLKVHRRRSGQCEFAALRRNAGGGVYLREFVPAGVQWRTSTSPHRRTTPAGRGLHPEGRHRGAGTDDVRRTWRTLPGRVSEHPLVVTRRDSALGGEGPAPPVPPAGKGGQGAGHRSGRAIRAADTTNPAPARNRWCRGRSRLPAVTAIAAVPAGSDLRTTAAIAACGACAAEAAAAAVAVVIICGAADAAGPAGTTVALHHCRHCRHRHCCRYRRRPSHRSCRHRALTVAVGVPPAPPDPLSPPWLPPPSAAVPFAPPDYRRRPGR